MDIDIGREVTVRRWRVEHAQYGGEDVLMNTSTLLWSIRMRLAGG